MNEIAAMINVRAPQRCASLVPKSARRQVKRASLEAPAGADRTSAAARRGAGGRGCGVRL